MSLDHDARESRKSTRVHLKVRIEAKGLSQPLTCEGETIVVNLHGARMSTTVPLRVGIIDVDVVERCPGRKVEKLLNEWVMLSRSGALMARGRLFDARDEVLSWFGANDSVAD